jgi:competence ComEA-like helix-hairpin-helix protein
LDALTPSERRGGLIVVFLLALGAGHDLWRASRPLLQPPLRPAMTASAVADTAIRPEAARAAESPQSGRIDLNRSSARELDALPGIGPVLADRIVAYRQLHGPFRTREDLLGVRGIGPRLYARISPLVVVAPAPAHPAPASARPAR